MGEVRMTKVHKQFEGYAIVHKEEGNIGTTKMFGQFLMCEDRRGAGELMDGLIFPRPFPIEIKKVKITVEEIV